MTLGDPDRVFHTSPATAEYLNWVRASISATVIGRRLFDMVDGWGGRPPAGEHVFVVTHEAQTDWEFADTAPFTFVTDGVASAVEQARATAGDRDVAVASPDVTRQCLEEGLLDAVAVDLVPVLLGSGKPFFAGLADTPRWLEDPTVVAGTGVTHLHYRVRRS